MLQSEQVLLLLPAPSPLTHPQTLDLAMEHLLAHPLPKNRRTGLLKLPKKKPSISSLFAPSLDPTSTSSARPDTSESPLLSLPPPSLLDDDPFANLACSTALSHVPPSALTPSRPRSSGHGQARPAYTRPAFAARPSLPSLHALTQMNVSVPGRKVRKGTPGAHLPHEPWDMDLAAEFTLLTRSTSSRAPTDPSPSLHNQIQSHAREQEPTPQSEPLTIENTETCFAAREIAVNPPSLVDETCSAPSLSADDADIDSLPSLSRTSSEPSSPTLSRSSSIAASPSIQDSIDVNSPVEQDSMSVRVDNVTADDDDPLSYHSDFDYYTQPLSDLSDSEPDPDPATSGKPYQNSPTLGTANTPYNSVCDPEVDVVPDTSDDMMRKLSVSRGHTQPDPRVIGSLLASQRDGSGWRGQRSAGTTRLAGGESETRGRRNGGLSSGSYGGDRNIAGEAHRGKFSSPDSSTPDYTSSSDDDADGMTVYYSLENGSPPRVHSRTHSRYSKAAGGSDDDIPLAQRVPTALSAQKSIRQQIHDERQQRKLERAKSSRAAAPPPLPPHPTESVPAPAASARFRKRSVSAAPAPGLIARTAPIETFPVEELTKKLMNLQSSSRTPPLTAPIQSPPRVPAYSASISRNPSQSRRMDHATYLQQKTSRVHEGSSQDRPLRTMRSFHRPDGRHADAQRPPNEQTSGPRQGHSATATVTSRTGHSSRDAAPTGHEQYVKSSRVSEDGRRPSASVPRASVDREGDAAQRTMQRPPVPPLPVSDSTPPQHVSRVPVVQQRIFIGDMQRFNMVEITPATNAGDVVETVASQGMLDRSESWMLFELAQDYGMERPIRDYEVLADVSASWNKDKLLNAFVIKRTPLAPRLTRAAIPTSSPTHRGWVEWESKRGKWSKRWMELREHGLWLSKRDTGKDEAFLCSLSNFDAYFVTRRHKSPKAFVFAIKSTDHPSLFENAADYVHIFSCYPSDGEKWMQVILVARSYVLYQERHVLFTKTGETLSQAKPLTRSRTRKQSVSGRAAQPLVNVPPPYSQSTAATIAFEPGSLLAKRKGDS